MKLMVVYTLFFVLYSIHYFGFVESAHCQTTVDNLCNECKFLPYLFFHVVSDIMPEPPPVIYMLIGNSTIVRRVDHHNTLLAFSLQQRRVDPLPCVSTGDLKYFVVGDPIPAIRRASHSAKLEEWAMVMVRQSEAVYWTPGEGQLNLATDPTFIGEYVNPSIVWFAGQLLLVTGSNYGRAEARDVESVTLAFRWLDRSRYSVIPGVNASDLSDSDTYASCAVSKGQSLLQLGGRFHPPDSGVADSHYLGVSLVRLGPLAAVAGRILGEDPRVVRIAQNRLVVFFTAYRRSSPHIGMGMAELAVDGGLSPPALVVIKHHPFITPLPGAEQMPQKNWSPFIHNGTVLLVQTVNPLTVVRVTESASSELVSVAPAVQIHWPFGSIHGGTNAVRLADGTYLALFHSYVQRIPGRRSAPRTYLIGAYTFNGNPPFRLLAASPMPIMPRKIYQAHKAAMEKLDYALFPVNAFVDNEDLVVVAGHNDIYAVIMKMNLARLLGTLIPLQT
jgi:predicted GH43/DUF377 family glycosyl hydrolase